MQSDTLRLRPIKKTDYLPLAKIISDTWEYEKNYSKKLAIDVGLLYLASNLVDQSYTCVAELDGKPVGVIMGKNEKIFHVDPHYDFFYHYILLKLSLSKNGRKAINNLIKFDEIDEDLLEETHKHYDAELVLFITDKNYRGHGIGNALYTQLLNYYRTTNVKNFYLFTDSDCNYKFYERKAMHKTLSKQLKLPDENTTCFIFTKDNVPKINIDLERIYG